MDKINTVNKMDKINKPVSSKRLQAGTYDSQLIRQVCQRAVSDGAINDRQEEQLYDALTCCHLEVMRLDLPKLLASSLGDFSHDVLGIIDNIDYQNGKLRSPFQPKSMTYILAPNIAAKAKRWFTTEKSRLSIVTKHKKKRAA